MRTSRLTTTAALLVLSGAATLAGTAGAFAADPTTSASAAAATTGPSTAATTEPTTAAPTSAAPTSAAPTTDAPTSAAPTTTAPSGSPSATTTPPATATPTGTPSATATLPAGCQYQRDVKMPVHTTDSAITLVKGGSSKEVSFSFQNTSKATLTDFRINVLLDGIKGIWLPKALTKVQNGAWTPLPPATTDHGSVSLGSFQVEPNEMITVSVQLSAIGRYGPDYSLTVSGGSEVLPWDAGPEHVKYACNRLVGSSTTGITVVDPAPSTSAPATGTSSPTVPSTGTGTPTTSASPTASVSTSPSASPSAGRPAGTTGGTGSTGGGATGTSLASTGASSSTVPLAVTGGMAIALGAGAVVVARRRRAAATRG
ncbi:LPXTG cell wall anchor domain-containing protein [Kitasatospora purpeofusca]|uniref:LPXTG cell wall anchor domain-containing protein n=1 Tax=Kitasatospora purpeofusca TaxID=67352 RepID=UPI00324FA44D